MIKKKQTAKKAAAPLPIDDPWYTKPETIRKFLEERPDYEQLCTEVEYILRKRMGGSDIEIAAVTSRAKTLKSFLEKLERKTYAEPFQEITDFAGVRVVCLYIDDIPRIEEVIRDEFHVLEKVDKLRDKEPDQFGYGAIHFIVQLGERSSGARYDSLRNLSCEIQVRTVVQDAWAIIDHHLAYKQESDVPRPLQRKLNSLAGLFETADDQFRQIRTERNEYVKEVRKTTRSPKSFLSTDLNLDSLREYLRWKFSGLPMESWRGQARRILTKLQMAGYKTLGEIDERYESSGNRGIEVVKALQTLRPNRPASALGTLYSSLAVVDPRIRKLMEVSPEYMELVKKYSAN